MAPLSAPSSGCLSPPKKNALDSSGSLSFGHEDKLSSGSLLEQSADESVDEGKDRDNFDEEGAALSPYVGGGKQQYDDGLEGSETIESSFEASSVADKEERTIDEPISNKGSPAKRNVKSVEVGSRGYDDEVRIYFIPRTFFLTRHMLFNRTMRRVPTLLKTAEQL